MPGRLGPTDARSQPSRRASPLRKQCTALATVACLLLGLPGCAGGEDEDAAEEQRAAERQRATDYVVAVERATDDLIPVGDMALATLDRLRDGSLGARRGAALLDRLARRADAGKARLGRLRPPDADPRSRTDGEAFAARSSVRILERAAFSFADQLSLAAIDVRDADRGPERLRAVADRQRSIVFAYLKGMTNLSFLVRALAIESAD